MNIRPFQPSDERAGIALWKKCRLLRPWNDPSTDIRRKLRVQSDMFLVGLTEGEIVATAMGGYDGHRGWVNYLAVAPEHRRQGLGRAMMIEAERRLRRVGCPKLNLQVRGTNTAAIGFYESLGYQVDDVVSLGKRLEPEPDDDALL